jgi:hypothetical protein
MRSGCKLNPVALGLAFGVLWGVCILFLGLVASYYTYGHDFVISLGNLYPGFTPSVKGAFLGGLIAFIDAFIMAYLIGWLYNKFNRCGCTCCDKGSITQKEP